MDEKISCICSTQDPSLSEVRICPISMFPCPGVCVFAEVLKTSELGIIIFDQQLKEVMFQNEFAITLLSGIAPAHDYPALSELLLPKNDNNPAQPFPYSPGPIRIKDRALGFTAYSASERFVWVLIRDVRQKLRLESIAEAVVSMNNIGYIFSGIRHEIGNPINTIKLTVSVLLKKLHELPTERVQNYLEHTLSEIERVEYLLRSLKSFNDLEVPELKETDILLFLNRFLKLVSSDLEDNGICIEFSVGAQQQLAVVDPRALHQVLLNLVTNAADALEDQPAPLITITSLEIDDRLLIKIYDNGCGMSKEQQEELFKPFVTNKSKGTGLGLVISRKMLAKMQGIIYVESSEGVGTTVTISLPAVREDESSIWSPV